MTKTELVATKSSGFQRLLVSKITWPIVTLLVSMLCVFVYWAQQVSEQNFAGKLDQFCQQEAKWYAKVTQQLKPEKIVSDCKLMLRKVHFSEDKTQAIMAIVNTRTNNTILRKNIFNTLSNMYVRFSAHAPDTSLTHYLMYRSESWNPWHMLTAVFAHRNISHLSLNLGYFLIFATFVEWMIGWRNYLVSFFVLVFGSQVTYSLVFHFMETAAPTIGLSGVVIGMIGIAVVLVYAFKPKNTPDTLLLVLWLLVVSFLAVNLFEAVPKQLESGINFVAHSAGAILGLIIGLVMYRNVRQTLLSELKSFQQN